jgi:phosphocarrier protein
MEEAAPLRRVLTISNQRGLHARASRKLAEIALDFDARIQVRCEEDTADATSLMDLLMLGAGCGSCIEVAAEGPDAAAAIEAIARLVDNKFGEE